ncbi:MAG: hypothetical protein HY021_16490 [Burkholderiales bacterium]|nr:hypothetical protein [Burkholderiales bacterium]
MQAQRLASAQHMVHVVTVTRQPDLALRHRQPARAPHAQPLQVFQTPAARATVEFLPNR